MPCGSRWGAAVAGIVALAGPGTAAANGRLPAVSTLTPDPADAPFLLVGATYGVVLTTDAGSSWKWICEQAVGYVGTYDPAFLRTRSGALMASTLAGASRSADGGCTWDPAGGLDAVLVRTLVEHPTLGGTVYATSAFAAPPALDGLFVSSDDGGTFAITALQSSAQYYDGVALSAADPLRIYVGSWFPTPREGFVHRSDDGGATWNDTDLLLTGSQTVRVLLASATDPDVVFWVVDDVPPVLYRSDDGAATFAPVLTLPDRFVGLAVAEDGTLYAGAAPTAIYRSVDGGVVWEPLGPPAPTCVAAGAGGRLWACTDPITGGGVSIVSSDDQGATFSGQYELSDTTGPLDCPAGTPASDLCNPLWPAIAEELGVGGGADAGVASDGGKVIIVGRNGGGGGCGCTVAARPGGSGAAAGAAALLVLLLVAWRRRQRCSAV